MSPDDHEKILNSTTDECRRLVGELRDDLAELSGETRSFPLAPEVRERGVSLIQESLTRAQALLAELERSQTSTTRTTAS